MKIKANGRTKRAQYHKERGHEKSGGRNRDRERETRKIHPNQSINVDLESAPLAALIFTAPPATLLIACA